MIQAIFFDLDGTLLDDRKQIPATTRAAIRRCRAAGVRTYVVTARSPRLHITLGWTDEDFALFDGAIHSNGACIKLGTDLQYCFINPEAVRRCVEMVTEAQGLETSLHLPGDGHAFTFAHDLPKLKRWHLTPEQISPIDETTMAQTMKMLIFSGNLTDDRPPLPDGLYDRLAQACQGLAQVLITDQGRTIQVVPLEAGKLRAVERIRQQLGLTVDEVAVFGDDLNDLEMIRHYPGSVAMGNAVAEVKAAAGYVTTCNEEDGIARGLAYLLAKGR